MITTNELEPLSTDLSFITFQIKNYESAFGRSVFEIGRRIKWVKDNDLAHGEYEKWLRSVKVSPGYARKLVTIYEQLSKRSMSNDLGIEAMYLIATMPPEERDKPQKLNSGETKLPDEMTVRELRETKKKLKQREQEISDKDAQIADQQAELEENRKTQVELTNQLRKASNSQPAPKVITKTVTKEVQVEPDDYEQLKQEKKQLEEKFSKAAGELDRVTNRLKDYEDAEHQEHRANHWKNRGRVSVYKLRSNIHNFLITNEIGSEDREAALDSGKEALESLNKALDDLQSWIDDKRSITGGRRTVNTLEGEIIK